jgi:hypothetical protein
MLETRLPPLALAWLEAEYLKKNTNLDELVFFAQKLEEICVREWPNRVSYTHDVVILAARARLTLRESPPVAVPLPAVDAGSPEVLEMNELAALVADGLFLRKSLSYYLYGAGLPMIGLMPTECLRDEGAGEQTLERIIHRYSLECKFKTHNDLYV